MESPGIRRTRPAGGFAVAWLVFSLAIAPWGLKAQGISAFRGQVVSGTDGIPVERAVVTLDRMPADGTPEYRIDTDVFGFFVLTNVVAADYTLAVDSRQYLPYSTNLVLHPGPGTNRVVKLVPIDGKVVFDMFFQVWCRATEAPLVGATVQMEYWKPGGDLSGGPDSTSTVTADVDGAANVTGMEDGFYRFTTTRPGWEPLVFKPAPGGDFVVVGDKVRLIRSTFATVFLKPIRTNLKVSVTGYDPVKNLPNQPLKGLFVSLTGVSLSDPKVVIVPSFTVLSQEDGSVTFKNLPPIQWKVDAGHLGYITNQALASPDATGAYAAVHLAMELQPTKLKVILASIYQTNAAVKGAEVRLEGVTNSNAEGISRKLNTLASPTGHTAFALFENLMPGRYYIRIKHQATISGLPSKSGILSGPDSFHVDFFQRESFSEVDLGATEELSLDLQPIPARVQGRLSATDELGQEESQLFDPEPNRIWHRVPQSGIGFLEHKVIRMLSVSSNRFQVDSDASGHYTILIPPGIFGVQIPTMDNYTGHNVEFGDLTAKVPPFAGPWPYPDVWPYATYESAHHGAGLRFDSGHDYQLDLFLHAHYINIVGQVQTTGEPWSSLVLMVKPGNGSSQLYPYNHLQDVGGRILASGTSTHSAGISNLNYFNYYLLKGLKPGKYSLTLDSPEYITPPVNLTIAPWQPPGVLPGTAPLSPGYFFPGITHYDPAFTVKSDWAAKGTIKINRFFWRTADPMGYSPAGTGSPDYFRMSGLPNRLFTFTPYSGGIPAPGYTIWSFFGDGWFSNGGSGSAVFDAYDGGDSDNTPPNNLPNDVASYTLDLHAYSVADHRMEIPGVTVRFAKSTRPAGGRIPHDDSPQPTGATQIDNKWSYAGRSDVTVVDAATRLVRVDVYMQRAMVVSGIITSDNGPVPAAAVVARNRYGNPIAQGITGADGSFRFPLLQPQAVYLDVNRRGYVPRRKRFNPPSTVEPDIVATITLQATPPPTIDTFTMNRFGLFLPGVLKSGDANWFTPDDARDLLTATWKSEARGSDFEYSLDGLVRPDESQSPPEQFQVVDLVSEVWIVDRRAFKDAFVNEPNQRSYDPVNPPTPLNYIKVMEWLADINAGQKDGQPYHVIHQLVHRGQMGPGNKFQGKFNLWELPTGVFQPRLIAITEHGGVAVKDYELPTDPPGPSSPAYIPLQGMNMPPWLAGFTELIAAGASAGKFTADIHQTYGKGFLKVGTASPVTEAHITLDPLNKKPDDDANITYKYVLGVEIPIGDSGTDSGPVTLAPSFMGYKVTGGTAEFEVTGKDRKAALALVFGGGKQPEPEERDSNYKPSITKPLPTSAVHFESPEFKQSAKGGASQILDADFLGNNILSGFSFILEAQGTVDLKADADLDFVLHKLPYAGPVLGGLKQIGLRVGLDALFETTLGSKLSYEHVTSYPRVYSGTQSATEPGQRWDFLGTATNLNKLELNLIARVAVGLRLTAKGASDSSGSGPKVEGSGLVQLGAPKGSNNPEGMYFQIDPVNRSPFFQRISGSFSLLARVGVSLWTIQYSKQWQYDLAKWDVDLTVQPSPPQRSRALPGPDDASMELTPIQVTHTVFNPATAPPFRFVGKHGDLVQDSYRPGAMNVAQGSKPLFAFTGIDPATGQSLVMVSPGGTGETPWTQPTPIASAGGILSLAVAPDPSGGWLAVWSEIAASDLGNPYPATSLKYSVSSEDGSFWSPPFTLTNCAAAIFNLNLARAGTRTLLTCLCTTEGPLGEHQTLNGTSWDGVRWEPLDPLLPTQGFRTTELKGRATGSAALAVTTDADQLLSLEWTGGHWSKPNLHSTTAKGAAAVSVDTQTGVGLVWQGEAGALMISSRAPDSTAFTQPVPIATNVTSSELQVVPIVVDQENLLLVAWTQGASGTNTIHYTITTPGGQPRLQPIEATVGSSGTYTKLHARALGGPYASVISQFNTATNSTLKELIIGMPTAGDCNGNGILDEFEIADGLVADCNHNGIPDSCEIASGTAPDRNHNGIPDGCETPVADDCNRNGISDTYELFLGIGDFDANGVLDACEGGTTVRAFAIAAGAKSRFYRAQNLRIRGQTPGAMELEYAGTLEQADTLSGPWIPVR